MVTGTRSRGSAPLDGPVGTEHRVPTSEAEALASVEAAEPVALPSPRGMARGLVSVFARPRPLAREVARLGRDSARILRGTDDPSPSPKDKRFADPAWSGNPGVPPPRPGLPGDGAALSRLVDDYETDGADWREVEQARFVVNAVASAMAPTNTLLGNPAALKRAFDTGGRSLVRGLGTCSRTSRTTGGCPPRWIAARSPSGPISA